MNQGKRTRPRRRPGKANTLRDRARRDRGPTTGGKTRVLLVDAQRMARATLRAAISAQPDMTVAGEAGAGEDSARAARALRPDVVIVNVAVPPARIAEAVAPVVRAHPRSVVLVVNIQDDLSFLGAALAAGAAECLVRKPGAAEIGAVLHTVRRLVADAAQDGHVSSDGGSDPGARHVEPGSVLSRRERQVLDLLARGHTRPEIAARLEIGIKSVETYRARLAQKLGVQTRADLVRYALETGILRPRGR
jgi:two-component system, NarL family, response regulator NreC